jgi:hypothetical protein
MAQLSHTPDLMKSVSKSIHERRNAAMFDNREKTARLMTAMMAALPFEIKLTSSTIAYLRTQHIAEDVKPMQAVRKSHMPATKAASSAISNRYPVVILADNF